MQHKKKRKFNNSNVEESFFNKLSQKKGIGTHEQSGSSCLQKSPQSVAQLIEL